MLYELCFAWVSVASCALFVGQPSIRGSQRAAANDEPPSNEETLRILADHSLYETLRDIDLLSIPAIGRMIRLDRQVGS